jgi:ATP-dependent DNA ligase
MDFSVLQNELKGTSDKIVMAVFDLFYLNGRDLRKLPLIERKAYLKRLIGKSDRVQREPTDGVCSSTPAACAHAVVDRFAVPTRPDDHLIAPGPMIG